MNAADVRPEHLASAMRMHVAEVFDLARDFDSGFFPPRKKPVGKKHRLIDAPRPFLKRRLRLLHRFLQRELPAHPCVHGGVRRRSCFSAAAHHCGRCAVITRDIHDCYPSITTAAFEAELLARGFAADTAHLLGLLLTVRGRVPQGSPVSGDALNIFRFRADERIRVNSGRFGGRYTRSADDMVISVSSPTVVSLAEELLELEISRVGLRVNEKKRRQGGTRRRHEKQLVHNINVNSPIGTKVSDDRERKAMETAEGYVRGARGVSPNSIVGLAARRERAVGHYRDLHQADLGPSSHIKRLIDAGDRLVRMKLRAAGLAARRGRWWGTIGSTDEPRRLAARWMEVALRHAMG